MEAARLLDEAQRRARREQLVAGISDKIRSAPDIDGILRVAVQEIRRALGVSCGAIRLGTETHLQPAPATTTQHPARLGVQRTGHGTGSALAADAESNTGEGGTPG